MFGQQSIREFFFGRRGKRRSRPRSRRLGMESLENRAMLAFTVVGNTLTIDGTSGNDDLLISFTSATNFTATANSVSNSYSTTNIAKVVFDGGSGTDTTRIDGDASSQEMVVMSPTSVNFASFTVLINIANTETNRVFLQNGDQATLVDSAGNDVFNAQPAVSQMSDSGGTYFNQVIGAGQVYGWGSSGNDIAAMFDSAGNDTFTGLPNAGVMVGSNFALRATSFDSIYSFSAFGGVDAASLIDSGATDDLYYGLPGYSIMANNGVGTAFYVQVTGFRTAYGTATGGTDIATFFDSAGNDEFIASPQTAAMFAGSGEMTQGTGFDIVGALAIFGGLDDKAGFIDSPGNDTFVYTPSTGVALLTGSGFNNQALYFEFVGAASIAGGNDTALLFDSAGNDLVEADGPGLLFHVNNGAVEIALAYFAAVTAQKTLGGTDAIDNDTGLDFVFTSTGSWIIL